MAGSPTLPLWDLLFYWLPLTGRWRHTSPPFQLARRDRIYWLATPRVPVFARHWSALRTLKRPLTRRLRPSLEVVPSFDSTPRRNRHCNWSAWILEAF